MAVSNTSPTTIVLSQVPNSNAQFGRDFKTALPMLTSPTGAIFFGAIALYIMLSLLDGKGKGKLATSYWGANKEKTKAKRKAYQQIAKPIRNSASLYIGFDLGVKQKLEAEWRKKGWQVQSSSYSKRSPTLYVPDAQRGVSVVGAAGSGKTFSVIDPLIRSSLDQGFPTIVYDFKYPTQTKRVVAYAMKRGYQVNIFAPGFPESHTCNPLDFLKNEEDAVAAGQLAQVINRNFEKGEGNRGSDKFFEEAGDSLVEGIFLLTKAIPELLRKEVEEFAGNELAADDYCDLMMAQALLSLPNLAERLANAQEKLNVWTTRPLSQLISVKDSEKTVAGIVGTAQRVFQRFLKKDFIGAFCGKTTLPLDVDGKQLLVFGMDRNNRDIVGPLVAAILHMVITRNVSRVVPRRDPLIVSLDELPTLYLPMLVNWLNENREDGFCGILGFQNMAQLEKIYGRELSRAILGGTGTKFLFNPQDPESAKIFADFLGEMEIRYKSKSRSSGNGKNPGSSSISEHHQKRHLFEAAQFSKLGTGRCVILNPSYTRSKEAYVPILQDIRVPQEDLVQMNWSEGRWDAIREALIAKNQNRFDRTQDELDRQLREELRLRVNYAQTVFPVAIEQELSKINEEANSTPETSTPSPSNTEVGASDPSSNRENDTSETPIPLSPTTEIEETPKPPSNISYIF